jgi:hypothetical protein
MPELVETNLFIGTVTKEQIQSQTHAAAAFPMDDLTISIPAPGTLPQFQT